MTYKNFLKLVDKRVKDGSLPKNCKYPTEFTEDVPENYQVVYVPQGLSLDKWNALLKKTCNGLWHSDDYAAKPFEGSGWRTELVYSADRLIETNITHREATDKYSNLISAETYLALQWNRLEAGDEPVGSATWSWLENSISLELPSGLVPVGRWDPFRGRVFLDWFVAGDRNGVIGVRFVGRGETRELDSSLSLVHSVVVEELTFNGVRYRRVEE